MRRAGRRALIVLGTLVLLALAAGGYALYAASRRPAGLSAAGRCSLGAWELPDGALFAVRQREGETLRVVFLDGRSPAVYPRDDGRYVSEAVGADGRTPSAVLHTSTCGEDHLSLAVDGGEPQTARRVPLEQRDTSFAGGDVQLAGRLVLPPGGATVPIAVLVHGSERDSALDGSHWQFLLPARGIGAFVYDKRGTGRSGGDYTQDFEVLAADANAAAAEARRLAGARAGEVGYFGGSQGGWVAPLAALRGRGDFVIAAYGLAESPLAEDREEVLLGLREAGFADAATRRKALEVTAATGAVMASRFTEGFDAVAAVKAKYGGEPWFDALEGEFTGTFVRYPAWVLRALGPRLDVGTSWSYEPVPTLEAVAVPHLWVLAGDDHEAPSDTTLAILREVQRRRPNLDVARFPAADHGMLVTRRSADGKELGRDYAAGYHDLVLGWLRTRSLAGAAAGIETWEGSGGGPRVAAAPGATAPPPVE